MSFGASSDDAALRAAWQQFCARLQAAGEHAFKDENPATPLQRADAFRFLTQNLGQAFDLALETKNTRSEEHTYELKSLMRTSYDVICLKKKTKTTREVI